MGPGTPFPDNITAEDIERSELLETLRERCDSPIRRTRRSGKKNCCLTWSDCGEFFAWSPGSHHVYVIEAKHLVSHSTYSEDVNTLTGDETSLGYIKKTVQRTTQIENRSCASPNIPAICIDTHADVWSLAFGSPCCNGPLNDNRWVYHDTSGLLLATGLANGRIKLWKIEKGCVSLIMELIDHTDAVTSLRILDQSLILASSSKDGTVKLWDLKDDGNRFQTLKQLGAKRSMFDCSWNGDGTMLALVGTMTKVYVYNIKAPNEQRMRLEHTLNGHNNQVVATAFSKDSNLLLSASLDTIVIMWDPLNGEKLMEFGHIFPKPCPLFSGGANNMDIRYLSFSPDGRHFTTVSDDSYVRFWDILNPEVPVQHAVCDKAFKCSYSSSGDRIALGNSDGSVEFWKAPTAVLTLQHMSRMIIRNQITRSNKPESNMASLVQTLMLPNEIKQYILFNDCRNIMECETY